MVRVLLRDRRPSGASASPSLAVRRGESVYPHLSGDSATESIGVACAYLRRSRGRTNGRNTSLMFGANAPITGEEDSSILRPEVGPGSIVLSQPVGHWSPLKCAERCFHFSRAPREDGFGLIAKGRNDWRGHARKIGRGVRPRGCFTASGKTLGSCRTLTAIEFSSNEAACFDP